MYICEITGTILHKNERVDLHIVNKVNFDLILKIRNPQQAC